MNLKLSPQFACLSIQSIFVVCFQNGQLDPAFVILEHILITSIDCIFCNRHSNWYHDIGNVNFSLSLFFTWIVHWTPPAQSINPIPLVTSLPVQTSRKSSINLHVLPVALHRQSIWPWFIVCPECIGNVWDQQFYKKQMFNKFISLFVTVFSAIVCIVLIELCC